MGAQIPAHGLWPAIPSPLLEWGAILVGGAGGRLERDWTGCRFVTEISDCVECWVVAEFQIVPVDRTESCGKACCADYCSVVDCWVNVLDWVR